MCDELKPLVLVAKAEATSSLSYCAPLLIVWLTPKLISHIQKVSAAALDLKESGVEVGDIDLILEQKVGFFSMPSVDEERLGLTESEMKVLIAVESPNEPTHYAVLPASPGLEALLKQAKSPRISTQFLCVNSAEFFVQVGPHDDEGYYNCGYLPVRDLLPQDNLVAEA